MNISDTVLAEKIFTQITAIAIDPEGRILFWNEGTARTYSRTAEQMIGRPLSTAFRCKYPGSKSEEAVLRIAREAGKWSGECLHMLADGRRISVESEIVLLRDEANRKIGFSLVIRDSNDRIKQETERRTTAKRAEDEARQKWEQPRGNGNVLERFLENLPVCAYVNDEKGRYLINNRATRKAVPAPTDYAGKTFHSSTGSKRHGAVSPFSCG